MSLSAFCPIRFLACTIWFSCQFIFSRVGFQVPFIIFSTMEFDLLLLWFFVCFFVSLCCFCFIFVCSFSFAFHFAFVIDVHDLIILLYWLFSISARAQLICFYYPALDTGEGGYDGYHQLPSHFQYSTTILNMVQNVQYHQKEQHIQDVPSDFGRALKCITCKGNNRWSIIPKIEAERLHLLQRSNAKILYRMELQ